MHLFLTDSFRNRLLAEFLEDDTWHERELNRYLCTSGRSYGTTSYSWKLNGNDLSVDDVQLNASSNCLTENMCGRAVKCLEKLNLTNDLSQPYHVLLERSACMNDDTVDTVNEFFSYVSVLVFPEVLGVRDEGIYSFNVNGSFTKFVTNSMTEANITVKPNNCSDIEIKVSDVSVSHIDLLTIKSVVCQVQASTNDMPQWFKANQSISSDSSGCDSGVSMYYTVETIKVAASCYSSHPAHVWSSIATLYWCNITLESTGAYSCRIPGTGNMKEIHVNMSMPLGNPSNSSNTELLLILGFGLLNAILIIGITITLVVWCWMRHSSGKKQKSVHSMYDTGLPAYLYNYTLEMETGFTENGSDPFEFPFDQLEFLNILGLSYGHATTTHYMCIYFVLL